MSPSSKATAAWAATWWKRSFNSATIWPPSGSSRMRSEATSVRAQPLRRRLRRNVALRGGQHFITDQELAHGRGAQQRRIKMQVQVPFRVLEAVRGPLVDPHRVRERNVEQAVVARRGALEDVRQSVALRVREPVDRRQVPLGNDRGLERPDGPERNHRQEGVVLFHHAVARSQLEFQVLAKKASAAFLAPCQLR